MIRIDSAASPAEWAKDPEENTKRIAQTFREACAIAEEFGERLAAEGEICWAGMHSWRRNVRIAGDGGPAANAGLSGRHGAHDAVHDGLQRSGRPSAARKFRLDAARRIGGSVSRRWPSALRPWTIDFHVAQNDGTVNGSGSHDKTGRHCQPLDPNGKLDIVRDAGAWMRDDDGQSRRARSSISAGMAACSRIPSCSIRKTWNDVLRVMIAVRDAHGWN